MFKRTYQLCLWRVLSLYRPIKHREEKTSNGPTESFRKGYLGCDGWEGSPVAQSHEQGHLNSQKTLLRCGFFAVHSHWLLYGEEASVVLKIAQKTSWLSEATNTVCGGNRWGAPRAPRFSKRPLRNKAEWHELSRLGLQGAKRDPETAAKGSEATQRIVLKEWAVLTSPEPLAAYITA